MVGTEQTIRLRTNRIRDGGVSSLDNLVGNTPLLRLRSISRDLPGGVELFAKGEHLNPGGSVKDRAALSIIEAAIRSGSLRNGRTLIDATSGNTGVAFAMLGAHFGIPIKLVIPANATPERLALVRAYGADVVLTNPVEGMDGAQKTAKEIVAASPDRYFYADQYNNDANWQAHYFGTAAEILYQTNGTVTHFVAGLGTTGTFVGTSRRLKSDIPTVSCISFQPDRPLHGIEGMKHLPSSMVPGIYDARLADEELVCSTEEAEEMTLRLAREEGLFLGISAGASVAVAHRVAQSLVSATVVTILCDTGSRYYSHPIWTEEYSEKGGGAHDNKSRYS